MSELASGTLQLVSSKGHIGCHQSECTLQTHFPALKVGSTHSDNNKNKQESWAKEKFFEMEVGLAAAPPAPSKTGTILQFWFQASRSLQSRGIAAGANDVAECRVAGKDGHTVLCLKIHQSKIQNAPCVLPCTADWDFPSDLQVWCGEWGGGEFLWHTRLCILAMKFWDR